MAGFGGVADDDADFADLLKQPTLGSHSYGLVDSAGLGDGDDDGADALNVNPFADLASSSRIDTSFMQESPSADMFSFVDSGHSSGLPTNFDDSFDVDEKVDPFTREGAPEPETPAFNRTIVPSDSPGFEISPFVARQELGFANFATSSPAPAAKTSLSELLGEEKPILPHFSTKGTGEAPTSKALPVSSIGRRHIRGPLAALLGEEDPEEEPSDDKIASTRPHEPSGSALANQTKTATTGELPLSTLSEPSAQTDSTERNSAAEVPLPPSAPATPPLSATVAHRAASQTPSRVPSTFSVSSADTNTIYDNLVSPMDIAETSDCQGTLTTKPGVDNLDQKLSALRVADSKSTPDDDTTSVAVAERQTQPDTQEIPVPQSSSSSVSAAPSSVHEEQRPSNQHDDVDSLRGAYSSSNVEAEMSEGFADRASMDGQRTHVMPNSPPLPPLPQQTSVPVPDPPRFAIEVGDPQKVGSSLNVAGQHTVYTVRTRTTSSAFRKSEFSVLRRYSHFIWLYDALVANNPGVIVPGMPEKSALGRFDSNFVENRRSGLQAALMKIVQHPMLVGDPDLRLFLESDTFAVDIKQRKIDSPSENKGLLRSWGNVISGPTFVEFDDFFEQRKHLLEAFETQLKTLLLSLTTASKARQSLHDSLAELQASLCALADCDLSRSLKNTLLEAAKLQDKVKRLGQEQLASEDRVDGFNSVIETYARLSASAKLIFGARIKAYQTMQSAESHLRKVKSSHEKARRAGRAHDSLSIAEITEAERHMIDAKQEFDDVSKLTKAEMARFDQEKVQDLKRALEEFVDGMAIRQREIVEAWQAYHDLLLNTVAENAPP
ncbi:Vacuolar protein sorting-associated protein vps5 [Microbotryomycetes sp. JL221]|nr:Vacuolar protein sorting-associated protein vps5 [Microbotryomycetes sp. JL221]